LISIKKYLDAPADVLLADENELLAVTIKSYCSSLEAIGKGAVQACPAPGSDLDLQLAKLASRLAEATTPATLRRLQVDVEEQLNRWANLTAEYLKDKTDGVKELLIMLARTAESVGERDQRYASQFCGLTADLQTIAKLDDLPQLRSSLVRKATELKSCVELMAQESERAIAALSSKVTVYESKLQTAEQLALKDSLTGVANRRCADGRMDWYIAQRQPFCVLILDLNGFKAINDRHGHTAGDSLLKQFASELQSSMRSTDLVARWGGDEFIVILNCELAHTRLQVDRIRQWTFGDYAIQTGNGRAELKVSVSASIGVAEWIPEMSRQHVIELADAAMYQDKNRLHVKKT
jgi:diguanylate cyclase (GGDEF)-like protein